MNDDYFSYFIGYRELEDGRIVGVIPLTFGRARIVITDKNDRLSFSAVW